MSKFRILSLEDDTEEPALDLPDPTPEEAAPAEPDATPPAEGPAKPVEPDLDPVDVTDLNVTKLGEQELKLTDTNLKAEEDERQKHLGSAITDLELLQTAAESFSECLYGKGTKREFALATEVYKRLRSDLGFKGNRNLIALEQFEVTDGKQLALESIKDTIVQVYTAIIKVISDAIAWLKKVFREFFSSTKRMVKANEQMTSMFLKHRKEFDPKFTKLIEVRAIDLKRYVDLPTHKMNLTYQDKQPPDMIVQNYDEHGRTVGTSNPSYAEAFDHVTELLKLHQVFRKNISADMLKTFESIKKSVIDNTPGENISFFNPKEFRVSNDQAAAHVEGIDCPDGSVMFAGSGYLGNAIFVTQFSDSSSLNPINDGLASWVKWKVKLTKSSVDMRDGWLGYITTEDVIKAFKSMADLSNELLYSEKTVDQVEHVLSSLEALLANFKATFKEDVALSPDENLERSKLFTTMASAAGSIVMNTNTYLTQVSEYAFTTQSSWLYYLNALVLHERQLMK